MTLRTRVAGLALAPLLLAGLTVAPATAVTGSAPVTAPDAVTITQESGELVDVLANDTDPDGDNLDVCRFGDLPDGLQLQSGDDFGEDPGALILYADGVKAGTYEVTYYACDFSYLTPGILTVTVERMPPSPVKVTKLANRPAKLRLVNRTPHRMHFVWGSLDTERRRDLDGDIVLGPRASRVIDVRRRSLVWSAFNIKHREFGFGIVRGIDIPPGVDELPPGVPPHVQISVAGRFAALMRS